MKLANQKEGICLPFKRGLLEEEVVGEERKALTIRNDT